MLKDRLLVWSILCLNQGYQVCGPYQYVERLQERSTLSAAESGMLGVGYLDRLIRTKYVHTLRVMSLGDCICCNMHIYYTKRKLFNINKYDDEYKRRLV